MSPPVSPRTIRHHKRSRASSKGELSVEELDQEDTGYDADVEVVRPDQYEEPESDFDEDNKRPQARCITAIDEEITRGMRALGWRQSDRRSSEPTRSSEVMHGMTSSPISVNSYGKRPERDMMDIGNAADTQAPSAKRRKKRESRSTPAARQRSSRPQRYSDSSDRTEGRKTPALDNSTESTATSEMQVVGSHDEMILD